MEEGLLCYQHVLWNTERERETLNKLPGCTVLSEYTYIQYVHEGPGSGVMGAALFSGV